MAPSIVFIDEADSLAPDGKRALLGGKGASLADMATTLSLPVPPAFTITTEVCRAYLSKGWPPNWTRPGAVTRSTPHTRSF